MSGQGDKSRFYITKAFEGTYGTPGTPDLSFLVSCDIAPAHLEEIDDNVNGRIFPNRVTRHAVKSAGTISGQLITDLAVMLFKSLHHTPPDTTGAGDPYTHVHKDDLAAGSGAGFLNAGKGLTVIGQYAGISTYIRQFPGIFVKTLTLSGSGEGKINFSAAVEGGVAPTVTTEPVAVSPPNEDYWLSKKTLFKVETTAGASAVNLGTRMSDWSITFNGGMGLAPRCGSSAGEYTSVERETRPSIELSVTIDEDASSEKGALGDYETPAFRKLTLTCAGGTSRDIVMVLASARLMDGYPLRINDHGIWKVQRKYQAFMDESLTVDFHSVTTRSGTASFA